MPRSGSFILGIKSKSQGLKLGLKCTQYLSDYTFVDWEYLEKIFKQGRV